MTTTTRTKTERALRGLAVALNLAMAAGVAQAYSLTGECNLPREGDRVTKVVIDLPEEILTGYDVLWDFSGLSVDGESHRAVHRWQGDTLLATENHERDMLRLRGDTLFTIGHRSVAKKTDYALGEAVAAFPLGYGGTLGGLFYSEGTLDQARYMRQAGHTSTTAVGYGRMITPDCDSLRHVLLVRTERHGTSVVSHDFTQAFFHRADSTMLSPDSIGHWLGTDSVTHRLVAYRWYSRGYRYPVVETGTLTTCRFGVPTDSVQVSWYTSPAMQEAELAYDAPNDSLRFLNASEPFWPLSPPPGAPSGGGDLLPGHLTASGNGCLLTPTVVDYETTVAYTAARAGTLAVSVFSPSGTVLWRGSLHVEAGCGTLPIDTSGLPLGTHVVAVTLGGDCFSFKIFKR